MEAGALVAGELVAGALVDGALVAAALVAAAQVAAALVAAVCELRLPRAVSGGRAARRGGDTRWGGRWLDKTMSAGVQEAMAKLHAALKAKKVEETVRAFAAVRAVSGMPDERCLAYYCNLCALNRKNEVR